MDQWVLLFRQESESRWTKSSEIDVYPVYSHYYASQSSLLCNLQ